MVIILISFTLKDLNQKIFFKKKKLNLPAPVKFTIKIENKFKKIKLNRVFSSNLFK